VPRIVALITVCANTNLLTLVFMQLKPYFNVHALIFFLISTCEESTLPMRNAKQNIDIF
jgi:hypothetical protein